MTRAFVFPGQASQTVGMGRELAEAFAPARLVFEEVDETLKQSLSRLMFEGPGEELQLTENAQPAILAVGMAVMRVLEEECDLRLADIAAYVAGHSLGEYTALAAAGALSLADAARLVKLRGRAMQEAVPVGEGAMAALIGPDLEEAKEIAAKAAAETGEVCEVANDNAPGQIVVSGHAGAVERAVALAAESGAKRSVMLPVSAPFHCSLMQPVADVMAEALAEVEIAVPCVPVIANVTAEAIDDPETIRERLVEQVTGLVRWRESVLRMKEKDVDTMIEAGAGRVLSGLVRRIDRSISMHALQAPDDIEAFVRTV